MVVERGFLISEITDLVLNVNPQPLVSHSGRRRHPHRSAQLKEKHCGRWRLGQEVGPGILALVCNGLASSVEIGPGTCTLLSSVFIHCL